jgi:osmoprotectant transport system permease protein
VKTIFDFIYLNRYKVLEKTVEHVSMSLLAVCIACLIGIPLGFMIANRKQVSRAVIGVANIIQTIPTLAMFAFVMPVLGIGKNPAVVALVLYALLPIIKNTLLGIQNISPTIRKAAVGMGLTRSQILFKVEVPISISFIMGGIRIAAVTSIGITTIATLIAAGGLGDFIYSGISMFNMPMVITGGLFSAILAILVDVLLGLIENVLTSKGLQ